VRPSENATLVNMELCAARVIHNVVPAKAGAVRRAAAPTMAVAVRPPVHANTKPKTLKSRAARFAGG
jgi:hypothetical protein|tara:strand:- start:65 stop:265 length:201 start_codon:yes stop_codon:yes gene_type:complete